MVIKANSEFIKNLEQLFEYYEAEVTEAMKKGLLTPSTSKTYLLHSGNFLKWCKYDFVPGIRKK